VPTDVAAGALESAPLGAGAAEAPRRELSAADELAVLDAEIVSLREAESAYAASVPERADAARRAVQVLSGLREEPA
jgi:hypothetical protein